MRRCLVCLDEIKTAGDASYHPACSKRLFGKPRAPDLDLYPGRLVEMGLSILKAGRGLTGAQKKLSMDFDDASPKRLTIAGIKGAFILKPQSDEYPFLPENEAFCMELARRLGIPAAEHGLMRDRSDAMAYLSRRFDRKPDGVKIHQEDFCQIAGRPSSDKYKGSLEAAAKALRHSAQAGLDAVRFLELNLYYWLSGNADMHLKNFSLLNARPGLWELSPAYDLLSTALVLPSDREETALTVNGEKANLRRADWAAFSSSIGVGEKVFDASIKRFVESIDLVDALCRASFLPKEMQESFLEIWKERAGRLDG